MVSLVLPQRGAHGFVGPSPPPPLTRALVTLTPRDFRAVPNPHNVCPFQKKKKKRKNVCPVYEPNIFLLTDFR